jgi:hypothetical protein
MAQAAKPKVIAVISGGVLQGVFTNAPVELTLIDWDQDHTEEDRDHYRFIIDDEETAVFVANGFPTNDLRELPEEERRALKAAGLDFTQAK